MQLFYSSVCFLTIIHLLLFLNGIKALNCLPCKIKKCKTTPTDTFQRPVSNTTVCDLAKNGMKRYAPILRDFTCFPPWMNYTKFVDGQRFVEKHHGKIGAAEHFTLIGLLSLPDMSDILLFTLTGDCPSMAYKRIITTTRQITLWGQSNLKYSTGPCVLLNSIEKVVEIHSHAGQRVRRVKRKIGTLLNEQRFANKPVNTKIWDAFKKDLEKAYTPKELQFSKCYVEGLKGSVEMNQFQYAMTQWSFSAMATLSPKLTYLGQVSDYELESFNHFWSVIGYLVGMENEYNIALQGNNIAELRRFYKDMLKEYILPALYNVNHISKYMIEESIRKGYGLIHEYLNLPSNFPKFLKEDSLILGTCRAVLNIPCKHTFQAASPAAKLFSQWIDLTLRVGDKLTNLDELLNSAARGTFGYWGNVYYGYCYNEWESDYCKLANNLHYKYRGPDINPDGIYTNHTCRPVMPLPMPMSMSYCNL